MRLIDYFINPLLLASRLQKDASVLSDDLDALKESLSKQLIDAKMNAVRAGYSESSCDQALFPIVAFIDEAILTSTWEHKSQWQAQSLQRELYDTSNAGHEFYERLNLLNRQGDDRSVREVYLLCLSLGFKGQYYLPQDRPKIEEIKLFNLNLLLPKDANNVFEKSTLFTDAYHERDQVNTQRKSRINLIPYFATAPFVIVGGALIFYSLEISQSIGSIMDVVK